MFDPFPRFVQSMASCGVDVFTSAALLPTLWDELVGDRVFLQRSRLLMLERTNPCSQHYVLERSGGFCCVLYRLKLNLFTYATVWPLCVPLWIAGLPASLAAPACAWRSAADKTALNAVLRRWPRLILVLNLDETLPGLPAAPTLSDYVLPLRWPDFSAYLAALRSDHRRIIRRNHAILARLTVKNINPADFDQDLYALYRAVYQRSKAKLECLPIDFFRSVPATIRAFYRGDRPVAFVQYSDVGKERYFLFGGFDPSANSEQNFYPGLLLYLLEQALADACSSLHLGQTADAAKRRLGAVERPLYFQLSHPCPLVRAVLRYLVPLCGWRSPGVRFKVFKEQV